MVVYKVIPSKARRNRSNQNIHNCLPLPLVPLPAFLFGRMEPTFPLLRMILRFSAKLLRLSASLSFSLKPHVPLVNTLGECYFFPSITLLGE
uniref:Uncharacterized protein n=1 Tax=Picea glauca TaxID=3330 RepID=A0A101LZ15_PICGL|nr:hypothetical protein ABT39_MTgene4984 [Picea glauca]QHR86587.1 hypothetical protein Q903MT_gene590 [Picea sitchensis]